MIPIKDKNLQIFLNLVLNKKIEDIELEDLKNIKMISYENNDDPQEYHLDLEELNYFSNLEDLNFSNILLTKENIEIIKKLKIKKLRLNHCAIDSSNNLGLLQDLLSFESIDSYHETYDFLKNMNLLEYLAITKPYTKEVLSLDSIASMNHLKKLTLEQCLIDKIEEIKNCKEIVLLNILGTKVPLDIINTLKELPNLKKVYIDKDYDVEELKPKIEIKNTLFEFTED